MAENFEELVNRNKRNSLLLAILFSCLVITSGGIKDESVGMYQFGGN